MREAKGKLRHAMDSIERELVDRRKRLPNKTGPENERVLNQLARFRRQMSELMQDAESWRKKEDAACYALYDHVAKNGLMSFGDVSDIPARSAMLTL